jgi:hypothetical protein
MKRRVNIKAKKKDSNWFDSECRVNRRNVRKALRKFRRTLHSDDRFNYTKMRREYKHLLSRKKQAYNKNIIDELVQAVDNQKEFWDKMHNVVSRRKHVKNNIDIHQWFEHFSKLLDKDHSNGREDGRNIDIDEDDNEHSNLNFNRPISKEEVLLAIRKLKNGKSAGPDGLIGEVLKNACDYITPFFVPFLNKLFDCGIFPDNWTESIVVALYKKGNVNDPGNYRGISICDVSSKIYSTIINKRIQEWVKENNVTGEYQAGFKQGYATVDHIFTLMACIQKQFVLNRKLYVAFIDFQKAFDSINRNILWSVLVKHGIKGKLYNCIQSMYNIVKAKVRSGVKLSECINCTAGVKQGDVCSPVLFSLFINELALEVINNGRHGVSFLLDNFELFILLLADDIVLISETVVGLQTQLNSLNRASISLGLKVNMDKSNIIVFRKGGYLAARESWVFNGMIMPVVNMYKYLGIYLSTKLSFTAACKDLGSRAKNAFLYVNQRLSKLGNNSVNLMLNIFDAQIQPIAQYGSEIWGLNAAAVQTEKIHLFALKKILGVSRRTPNDLVYGELNRYPITINSAVNTIRYWLKVLQMSRERLPRKAYGMIYNLDERGKITWATDVRLCLFKHGFGYVWLNQGVGNVKGFLKVFKERLIDCRWQDWRGHIEESERFKTYRLFGNLAHSLGSYLNMDISKHFKYLMTKFRFGVSDLLVHRANYRYRIFNANVTCPLCFEEDETELHFLLSCPFYDNIRKDLIAAKYTRSPNAFRLILLLSSNNESTIAKLCLYLYKAFKAREIATT